MAVANSLFQLLHFAVLGVLLFTSIILLGVSASLVNASGGFFPGANFALATSILTLISLGPILVIDFLRAGAVTSFIFVELIWAGFLGILWLAVASDWGSFFGAINCDAFFVGVDSSICHQEQTVEAFAWINWLICWGWMGVVLVLSIISHSRGNNRVWFSPVGEGNFMGKGSGPATQYPQTYQTQPQAGYPPQQV
jgi:hypothetical protein